MANSHMRLGNCGLAPKVTKMNKNQKKGAFGPQKIADPLPLKWPEITTDNELKIVQQLERIFDEYKTYLQTIKKPPKWKKQDDQSEPVKELSQEDKQRRDLFKSWFVIGMNSVMKNLEKDKVRLVVLCKSTQPSLLKKAILHLVHQHNCPAICVPDLLPCLQKSWPGLSSATVLAVLKTDKCNDFDVLVDEVDSAFVEAGLDRSKMYGDIPEVTKLNTTKRTDSSREEGQKDTETVNKVENISEVTPQVPQIVDGSKYYIYKSDSSEVKKFTGESFISFGKDGEIDTDVVYKTVNGKREISKNVERSNSTFGIRPPLESSSEIQGSRKRDSVTSYQYDYKKARVSQNDTLYEDRKYKNINMKKKIKNADKKTKNKKKRPKNK